MENPFEGKEIWFGVGSQDLYGEDTLRQVAVQSTEIVDELNKTGKIPVKLILKPTLKSSDAIKQFMTKASSNPACIGVVAWMHTFSPAKMWIRGLEVLTKPLLQLNTQHHFEIPWDTIDMDFMNLNQAAHGDREFGYILSRLGIARKIVVGHYTDPQVAEQIGIWARACVGWDAAQNMRVMRWGDNMRNVAVTEGDKTEAERVFGTQVNTWSVNELVSYVDKVKDDQVKMLIEDYKSQYDLAPELLDARYDSLYTAAKEEAGLVNMMNDYGATAAVDNFEDLGSLSQLPGVGAQRLPSEHGFGFSAEGDWKTSMLVRIGAVMGAGLEGGASLMEDYSYNFVPGHEAILGSHMLEVSPSVGSINKPRLEIHPLGIGNKADPVRLVFTVAPHKDAVVISMADMRERFRLVMNVADVVPPDGSLRVLPTARALWKPQPSLKVSAECWLRSGAAHHTCMTTSVGREAWEDFARIAGVELATIDEHTTPERFEKDLMMEEIYHRLENQH
ncbi:L-arabinose isomerase [Bombiscardovia coagulans]|uniref:L-arabinose isomerase n=1 Tax=Bombiscardovia coagulans TaxID=686666 RepID=A0A261EVH4_9BIFI|nr:L-arabinose isomerase [Bombiscardovia coagulans]OZG50646.1 arabinose isomerase [Bombiscardovia coagulans]